MIERGVVAQKIKEFQINDYIEKSLSGAGYSHAKMQRTPLGEKIIVFTSRPGLIVGKEGSNIKRMTHDLKTKFGLENPQIEIAEVENINLDPRIIGDIIKTSLERFGTSKFKGIAHKAMETVMGAGARGIEIMISGKVPSTRAKRWRFWQGYLKKSGEVAVEGMKVAYIHAQLKSGVIGIQVRILPPDVVLPDRIRMKTEEDMAQDLVQEAKDVQEAKIKAEQQPVKKARKPREHKAAKPAHKEAKTEEKPAVKEAAEEKSE